ncbi:MULTISPECIES: non-ribosomal peptide synthetase [Pseudomonas fluorescens group]|uniref:LgrD_2 protein n=1 Tax=Pseudomonas fluorescens TaxID=294 RepID=A0A0D0TKM6_PSEFL|nr:MULTISPECIES: non-ribosomal peptide synthetase [Pseudomonas fluorescens group]AZE60743.1 Non-ribosomal peptide synthetase [Pseudomonas synxantha]KIR21445.1 Linear gramicidin synthase subunit D [Pseudomonas fluorescens]
MNAEDSLKLARRFIGLPLEKRQLFLQALQKEGVEFSRFPIPAGVEAQDRQALSYAQQRMWFLWQLDPASGAYNLPGAVRLIGALNLSAMEQAFASLVARHETLRTVFQRQADEHLVQVAIEPSLAVEQLDVSALPAAEREQAVNDAATRQSLLPFDLEHGPLLRVQLLKLADQEHVLLLTLHHIVSDGWSMNVLIDEFIRCYDAHERNETPQLPALPIQYSDYALWQRRWLEAGEQARQLQYWQARLGDEHPVLELPTDHPRPAMPSYRGTRHNFAIDPALAAQLRSCAQKHNVTLFMLLLGAFNVLLHRYSGQGDIRVGVPIANRNRTEVEGLIGFFVNTQVLRTELSGQTRVAELLQGIKEHALGAQAHQELPFERLVEALKLERSLSHTPLFQVMYNHQPVVADIAAVSTASGLELALVEWQGRTTQFDLTLDTYEKSGTLHAALTYASDLFDAPTVERMAQHWISLLQAMVVDGAQRIGELPMLDASEQQRLVHTWNQTAESYPTERGIHHLIEDQVQRTPNAPALVFGTTTLTYAQLDARANQLAHALGEQGVGPDVLVGICVERSVEMVIGLLAILKAGGAYVPLDPEYPQERLAYMIEDSGVQLLLSQQSLLALLPAAGIQVIALDQPALWLDGYSREAPAVAVHALNLAYVIYTSGSTGKPKGAGNSHRALVNRLSWMQQAYGLDAGDAVLQKTPFSFDVSVWEFFWPLMTGARLVVAAPGEHREPARLIETIGRHAITTLHFVPSMLQAFIHEPGVQACTRLKRIVCSGEALPLDAQLQVFAKLPGAALYNLYGPTEAAIDVTHWTCIDEGADSVPIGRPIANLGTYVLDAQLNPVPAGVAGELYLGGTGLARSYHQRPALTAERFVPSPFVTGERLYRTGDRVRQRADGVIEYLGRLDHQVKLRGLRIELGEIETRLMQHPQVREAVVLVQGGKQLVAYLVLEDEEPTDLKAWLLSSLPEYMVPTHFITLAKLPVTANGKLDRKALPVPDATLQQAFVAPENALQKALAAIWSDVLGVEQVGQDDNFFELGGDSIVSMQLVSRARQADISLSPKDVFQHQTLRSLAQVASLRLHTMIDQGAAQGQAALSPVQQWFFAQDIPQRQHWNQSLLLIPREPIMAARLDAALQQLVNHHDGLRLRYQSSAEGWQQHYSEPVGESVLWQRQADSHQALAQLCNEAQRSLNLQDGPLLRALLVQMPDHSQRLLLVIHHLVVDGVSWRILLDDLQQLYAGLREGAAPALAGKTTSYQAWTARLQGAVPRFLPQLEGWQARHGQAPTADLPCDNPQGALHQYLEEKVSCTLDADTTRQLLTLAPAAYRTQVNDLLLTALARVVCRWSGQASALVQLEGHGREDLFDDVDLTRSVGWFTSMFPVNLTPAHALSDSIKAVKEQLRAVPDKGIGYGVLRYLAPSPVVAALAALPQPRITFNYLGQFDRQFDEGALFVPSAEGNGLAQDPLAPLANWLTVEGQVYGGELSLQWGFSREMFSCATIQQLADDYAGELKALIAHCCGLEAGQATPSDFPLAGISQSQLDALAQVGAEAEDLYPLSPMQQGMLFHSLYEQDAGDYINQMRVNVQGLDVARFRAAWQATVDAQDILRTGFIWPGDWPQAQQMVHRQVQLPFSVLDWRNHEAVPASLDALAQAQSQQPFDLARPPLLRLVLVQLTDTDWHLIYTHHHILMDGWSNSQLLGEVLQRYSGQKPPAAVGRYRDYIAWLQEQDSAASEAFWKARLLPLEQPTRLAQAQVPTLSGPAYGEHYCVVDATQTRRLHEFARQQKVTPNTLVQAAWLLLLQRYSAQATVAFGATVAGRPAHLPGVEQQIGLFINTLPVVATPQAEQSLGSWLQSVQALNLSLREHEHAPLYEIQRWAGRGGEALFDTILVFENYPVSEVLQRGAPDGLYFEALHTHEQTSYPLTLTVNLGDTLTLHYSYAHGHFSTAAVQRLGTHLSNLLKHMLDAAELPLAELSLLDAQEHQSLVHDWSSASLDYPSEQRVHQLFEAQVTQQPSAPALLFEDRQLTYAELNARANRLARHLVRLGVGPDVLVGIAVERGLDMIIGLLAVLKAGGAYVPLDPEYPQDRLLCMIEDSGTRLMLTQSHLRERLAIPAYVEHLCLDQDQAWVDLDASNLSNRAHAQNLAYVMFTSGSTGRPKGVGINQLSLTRHAYVSLDFFNLKGDDRILQFSTFNFDGFVEQLYPALICGASVVLRGTEIWDTETFYRELIKHQISVVDLTTAYWNLLAKDFAAAGPRDYGRLKQVHAGGEAMPPEGLAAWAEAGLGHVKLLNTYGPTEATVTVTALDCTDYVTGVRPTPLTMPIGKVLAGRSIYLLDDSGAPAPIGVVGELVIGGELLARGYFNRPDLTAERFMPDPFSQNGGRLYRTGDLARYNASGVIEYVGRIDHQVKIRGFRIELGEIEARLLEQEQVRDAIVLAQPAASGLQLVGYVVPHATALSQAELRQSIKAALAAVLPDYMVPGLLMFLDALPLSPNGKLDRKALPKPDASQQQNHYVAPRTALEVQVAGVWQSVLELEQVGLDDHFFELGGHSLLATQVVARLKTLMACNLTLRDLFGAPRLADFVATVAARSGRDESQVQIPLVAQGDKSSVILSLAQRRLWVVEQLSDASGAYGMPLAVRLRGELSLPLLIDSLAHVVARHETLRTAYISDEEGDPLAIIAEHVDVDLPMVDLSSLDPAEQERRIAVAVEANTRQPISLLQAPLLRGQVLKLGPTEHVLLYSMHHIISDGWSMAVLVNELVGIYARTKAGVLEPLPPLPIQYSDYALWQQQLQETGVLAAQARYWEQALAGHSGVLQLPTDKPRPQAPTYAGRDLAFTLPAALHDGLKTLSAKAGVTLYSTMLAAFQVMLHRLSGCDDVLVGADVAGRQQPELEGLIGFFVNILPLRSSFAAQQPFNTFLANTQGTALDAFEHQDLPFDMIVEASSRPRQRGLNPLVQVLFVMNNLPVQGGQIDGIDVQVLPSRGGYSKFDMALFIDEDAGHLHGTWQYASDLFDQQRIESFVNAWTGILEQIVCDPNIQLGDITMPTNTLEQPITPVPPAIKADKLGKFLKKSQSRTDKPAGALVRETLLVPEQDFPLLMEPTDPGLDLVAWIKQNRALVEAKLARHAGILFRGFALRDIHDFEAFAEAVQPGLYGQYGDLPKKEGGKNTYRSTPYPEKKMILFHNESSHQDRWPRKQLFFCEQPSPVGGATPVVDCRQMYLKLPVAIRERFEDKGLLYVRTFADKLDVSWQHFFKTDVRADVEARCRAAGIEWTWLDNDELQIRTPCPAIIRHPVTGEKTFFNQVQLHHIFCLDPDVREDLLALFGEQRMPRHVYYGDGSPIEDEVMALVGELYEACAVRFDWQKGDVILLDNMLAAHARDPFEGPRKIVVAMGEMIERSALQAAHSETAKEEAGA